MNRKEMAIYSDRLAALGQAVKSDYAGGSIGYRIYVRTPNGNAVVLKTAAEAEKLTAGLKAKG